MTTLAAVQPGDPHARPGLDPKETTVEKRLTAWDLLGIAPDHPGGRNAIRDAAEAWRQWLTGSLVRMQELDDTEQALIDALARDRCGQCRRCDECRRDAPFADPPVAQP